jgi:hypothetical protein
LLLLLLLLSHLGLLLLGLHLGLLLGVGAVLLAWMPAAAQARTQAARQHPAVVAADAAAAAAAACANGVGGVRAWLC